MGGDTGSHEREETAQPQTPGEVTVPKCPPHSPWADIWAVHKPAAEPLELFSSLGWGKQLEVITTLAVSSWQQHINQRHTEMGYTDTSKLSRKLLKPASRKHKDKCSIRLLPYTFTHRYTLINGSVSALVFFSSSAERLLTHIFQQKVSHQDATTGSHCPAHHTDTHTPFYFLPF